MHFECDFSPFKIQTLTWSHPRFITKKNLSYHSWSMIQWWWPFGTETAVNITTVSLWCPVAKHHTSHTDLNSSQSVETKEQQFSTFALLQWQLMIQHQIISMLRWIHVDCVKYKTVAMLCQCLKTWSGRSSWMLMQIFVVVELSDVHVSIYRIWRLEIAVTSFAINKHQQQILQFQFF